MKVYCKDCKYFKEGEYVDYCTAPQLGVVVSYIYGNSKKAIDVDSIQYPNRYGECEYYKPKLFKRISDRIINLRTKNGKTRNL
jgi:hypothetical protein